MVSNQYKSAADTSDLLDEASIHSKSGPLDVDVAIVGAGISGVGMGIELQRRRVGSFVLLESAQDLGGTWRDNTYPGVAVDIPSTSYSFSYETCYPWSRLFAPGHDILSYIRHCADKYGITPHIRYGSRVVRSVFDAERDLWATYTDQGKVLRSRYLISATGLFNKPKYPDIAGLDSFVGKLLHTARWDHDYDFTGRKVGMIGTGASAVQVVPAIAPFVSQLEVFQRTPIWVARRPDCRLPSSSPLAPRRWSAVRRFMRIGTEIIIEGCSVATANYTRLSPFLKLVEHALRNSMRRCVNDPETAERLLPRYGLGCKRATISNDYLQTFNRSNVRLVIEGIERICPEGIVTSDGKRHDLDVIVLGTGFLTTERGNSPSFEVVGLDEVELGQFWEEHRLQAYSGVSVPGFPNFFLTSGPYGGGFNWFAMLEAHLLHIMQCIKGAESRGVTRVQIDRQAHDRYMREMWRRAEGTVFKDAGCVAANSFYIDRHGDASLTLPTIPSWRWLRVRIRGTAGYRFGS